VIGNPAATTQIDLSPGTVPTFAIYRISSTSLLFAATLFDLGSAFEIARHVKVPRLLFADIFRTLLPSHSTVPSKFVPPYWCAQWCQLAVLSRSLSHRYHGC